MKKTNKVNGTKIMATMGLVGVMAVSNASQIFAGEPTKLNKDVVEPTLAYRAEMDAKNGVSRLETAYKLFTTQDFKVRGVGDSYTSEGIRFKTSLNFATEVEDNDLRAELMRVENVQKMINNTEYQKVPYLDVDFDSIETYLRTFDASYLNLEQFDENSLSEDLKKELMHFKRKNVIGILRVNPYDTSESYKENEYYLVSKEKKSIFNLFSKDRSDLSVSKQIEVFSEVIGAEALLDAHSRRSECTDGDFTVATSMTYLSDNPQLTDEYITSMSYEKVNGAYVIGTQLENPTQNKFYDIELDLQKYYVENNEEGIQDCINKLAKLEIK